MRDREFAGTPYEVRQQSLERLLVMQVAPLRASECVIQDTPVFQMSYDDPYSMIDLVKSARCIINVAGPYMLTQGELMIDACISMGSLTRFTGSVC